MILYFTGTGNSRYVANRIANETNKETIDLFLRIKEEDYSTLYSERPWIVVAPTYAWRIPRVLEKWLENADLTGSRDIYFVMTCGGDIANAGKYLKTLCTDINMNYLGCYEVVMPENYIAMFETPTEEEAIEIIDRADREIDKAIDYVKNGDRFPELEPTMRDKLISGIVNDLFYPLFVKSKKFYATDECISCGLCEKVCPLDNVEMVDGKPSWGKDCTHCMACISYCPEVAIEYGDKSQGLPRYTCPR